MNNDCEKLSRLCFERFGRRPTYFVRTYGCQQNVNDSEHIKGLFEVCGFDEAESAQAADIAVFNTCAVREHAEDRVFGNVGRLKSTKLENPNMIIAVGGCMVQQPHIAQTIKKTYPYIGVLFDTNDIQSLPSLLCEYIQGGKRVFYADGRTLIDETLPIKRDDVLKAFLPIMYGCDNFCSYCIVPYVRHRERSREADNVEREFRGLVESGCKDITLLGQNVNSYGKNSTDGVRFPELLRRLAAVEGEYTIRFMTSHPKDATRELIDVIAENKNISRHFHLPVQSGSDRILKLMNRKYTSADYLSLIDYAREKIPDISFTSDIIVGFPGETEEDFEQTLELVKKVRFKNLFTFIYSKREGTPAAKMPDPTTHEQKVARLNRLSAVQDAVTVELESALVGRVLRGLPEIQPDGAVFVRLDNNSVVETPSRREDGIGTGHCRVSIDEYKSKRLYGRIQSYAD